MDELWIAIVLECWYEKSHAELERYGYTHDRNGFCDAMGFTDHISYQSFRNAWL